MKKFSILFAVMFTAMSIDATVIEMTCAQARAAALALPAGSTGKDSVAVTGYVTSTDGKISRGQQLFWMDDQPGTSETFQSYYCYMPDSTPVLVGDKVIIKGRLANYGGTNPEIKNGRVIVLERVWKISHDTLIISGTGKMQDFNSPGDRPWRYFQDSITEIVINEGVTSIGSEAFSDCTGLTSITIPSSVTSIGSEAFSGCTGLTSITIPNSVTSIGYGAFEGCTGLTSVTIPNSVTSIGYQAFYGCSGLTSVTIGNSVTSIGWWAFSGCTGLASVTIGNSVTSIGSGAFYGCTGLTSVIWNAKNYADFASNNTPFYADYYDQEMQQNIRFDLRPQITSFTFGNEVEHIPANLCNGMSNLTSIEIPNSVTSIGNYAFFGCSSLTSLSVEAGNAVYDSRNNCNAIIKTSTNTLIFGCQNTTIPNSVTSIGDDAFFDCSSLTSITIPNSVTSIGSEAFSGCTGLTSITIPSSVTSIGSEAFSGCTGLTSITIPSSVTSIGSHAFSSCSGLTSVTIPNSVTSIEYMAFYGCSGLTSVTIPNSVTSIGNMAFCLCSSLTSVTIPSSVKSIGYDAFGGVINIVYSGTAKGSPWGAIVVNGYVDGLLVYNDASKTQLLGCSHAATGIITIPNSVTSIGEYAFYDCSGLTSVTIPNSVTSIGREAFKGCSGMTSVTIGNGVTSIGASAFSGCSGLTSVSIPNSVTSIGDQAFSGCRSLTSVTVPSSVTSLGEYAFYNCSSMTSVTIGNGVTSIGNGAFELCSGMTSVTIGNGVTSIGDGAFAGCSNMETVSLGKSLQTIGAYAFYGCQKIIDIYCYAKRVPVPDVVSSTFDGVSRKAYLWVPANRLRNYQTHEIWGEFVVQAMSAEGVNASTVNIVPDYNTAKVVWPEVTGADTYEIVIRDQQGNVVCTLIFNAQGQLTSIAFAAPSAERSAEQGAQAGFSFTVTGLEEGESYTLTITAKDAGGTVLNTVTQSFFTGITTSIEETECQKSSFESPRKVIENGRVVIILPNGRRYSAQGALLMMK